MDDYDPAALARRLAAEHAGGNIENKTVDNLSEPPQTSDEAEPILQGVVSADLEEKPTEGLNRRFGQATIMPLARQNPGAPTIAELRTESNAQSQLVFSSAATFSATQIAKNDQDSKMNSGAMHGEVANMNSAGMNEGGADDRNNSRVSLVRRGNAAPQNGFESSTEAQAQPARKSHKPKKPLNLRILILCVSFGVLIAGFWLYFAYFYYWSGSFTGTTQVAQLEVKKSASKTEEQTTSQDPTGATKAGANAESSATGNAAESAKGNVAENATGSGFTTLSLASEKGKYFSKLSGEELSDLSKNAAPTFCLQIPNGVDGGRPQVGLAEAKVVFEAITEAGITRFAAIYQNELPSVIGPIRSLRSYYLYWDTPFDCIVVHAGGADDALSALRANNYRELDEDQDYMFRDTNAAERLWNNLFATQTGLTSFAQNLGYLSSDIQAFLRYTPVSGAIAKVKTQATHPLIIDQAADGNTSELKPRITKIDLRFGEMPNFNPVFSYDVTNNSYLRAYETGEAHLTLDCGDLEGSERPSVADLSCTERQVEVQSVVVMMVQESRAADNYHENIAALGTGVAYVFQNGGLVEGTWEKSEVGEQIVFRDNQGQEIKLVPGLTWIAAVPTYGGVEYE